MAVRRFEELEVWRRSRALAKRIYGISGSGKFARDFALRDQVRRAAISVVSNIAEGFKRDGNREFIQFLHLAKASAGEIRAQLHIAADPNYCDRSEYRALVGECATVSQMLAALISRLKSSEFAGRKYDAR